MTRWERPIAAGTLLEISFEQARDDPPQALVFEVDKGRLAWDEQGEEASSLRVWADRHGSVVLRLTGRFARVGLSVWHAWLDSDLLDGEVVRAGDGMLVDEQPGSALLRCGDDLVARVAIRSRAVHGATASSE